MLRTARFINIAIIAATAFAASSAVAGAQSAGAQDATARHTRWEFLVSSGKLVPTGAQRAALETGDHSAAQLSRVITPSLAMTSTTLTRIVKPMTRDMPTYFSTSQPAAS